jgi:putative glutamine amidotransferase
MKPIVGVMPLWDDEKNNIWMRPGYMNGISQAGGLPIVFPFSDDEQELEQLAKLCDGFLFTGGPDISPKLYHEDPVEGLVTVCPKRDILESIVFRMALEQDKPVLGICRGIQVINVFLGGTLYQDIPMQHPSETEHHQAPPYDKPVHDVRIAEGSPLHQCFGVDRLPVNSHHHQAIQKLAPRLQAMAFSPDGLIEAAYMPEKKFIWAVQWHPEHLYRTDIHSRELFQAFVYSML